MRTHISRKILAAIAAFGLVGAVLTPALVATESASAAAHAPFIGYGNWYPWVDKELAPMYVGVPYSDTVMHAGPEYVYWAWGGATGLPAGLNFSYSGNTATLSGTPTTPGVATIAIANADPNDWSTHDTAYFDVIVREPITEVTASLTARETNTTTDLAYLTPGQTYDYQLYVSNNGGLDAPSPTVVVELPAEVVLNSSTTVDGWSCAGTSTVTCSDPGGTLLAGEGKDGPVLRVTLDAGFAKGEVTGGLTASADNAPESAGGYSTRVYLSQVVLVAPESGAYNNLTLTAYAPFAATDGWLEFYYLDGATWVMLEDLNFDSAGSATVTITNNDLLAHIGTSKQFYAVYRYQTSTVGSTSEPASIYIYKQLTFGGSFYLNGELYTDPVNFYMRAGTGGFSYAGDRTGVNAISGGTYSITSPSSFGYIGAPFYTNYNYLTQSYYFWAELPAYGNAATLYNTSNIPNASSAQLSEMSATTYTNDMNFYWELAPSFSDQDMVEPRVNIPFTGDGVEATSNVAITYSISDGLLPTGLYLNSTTGAITGTATTLGQEYHFVVKANNGYGDAFSDEITGTVLSDVPVWTDTTLDNFRADLSFSDGVSADGNPTITYSVDSGQLPLGLTLSTSTGAITGTPQMAGEVYGFTIRATNALDFVDHAFYGTVLPALTAPIFTDSVLGEFRVDESASYEVVASGVPAPTFSYTGVLPSGITVNSDGTVTGTPAAENDYDFYIVANNGLTTPAQVHFEGTVLPAWLEPSWTDDSLEFDPQVGVTVTDGVDADGDGTIVYKVKDGSLPAWMSFDPATGALYGTPTADDEGDSFGFAVRARSEHGYTSTWISGTVGAAPAVSLDPDFVVGDTAVGATGSFEITGAGSETDYDVTAHSTPVVIAVGTTSIQGNATGSFTIPAGLGIGAHSLVLTATAADGTPRTFTIWFTILADGTIGAISYAGPITFLQLVTSGTDAWVPGALALGMLALGGILLVRRRKELQQS